MHHRINENRLEGVGRRLAVGALVWLAVGPAPGRAQQAASAPAQPTTAAQPSLAVDRDPAPSPDVDPPPQAIDSQHGTALGSIAREAGGKYTLHEDAYEVRLNASVFDQTGKSVQTLDKG